MLIKGCWNVKNNTRNQLGRRSGQMVVKRYKCETNAQIPPLIYNPYNLLRNADSKAWSWPDKKAIKRYITKKEATALHYPVVTILNSKYDLRIIIFWILSRKTYIVMKISKSHRYSCHICSRICRSRLLSRCPTIKAAAALTAIPIRPKLKKIIPLLPVVKKSIISNLPLRTLPFWI